MFVAGKKIELGESGATVAANVKRARDGRPYTEVSKRLKEFGRDIPPLALRRIEECGRRVDSDDLVALALALGVSPLTLLMPLAEGPDVDVTVTGVDGTVSARRAWEWLVARRPLGDDSAAEHFGFTYRALPAWLLGDEVELVERGVAPNITRTVEWKDGPDTERDRGDGR